MPKAKALYPPGILSKRRIEQLEAQLRSHGLEPEPSEEVPWNPNLFKRCDEIEFSVRVQNCFDNERIELIWQLVEMNERQLLKIQHFGRKCLHEINEVLKELNLTLGMKLGSDFPRVWKLRR